MKNSAIITILASAAVTTAQVTVNNGTYVCSKPNVDFCAGDSMKTDIIVRCDSNGIGQPGRCSDNLAGEPPVGLGTALCFQTDATTGDAACEKNCIVYGGSGNGNGTFTLPADQCTPTFSATTSSGVATETTTNTATQCGQCESTSTPAPESSTTEIVTEDTTICPSSTGVVPTSSPPVEQTTTPLYPTGNGTVVTSVPTSTPTTLASTTPIAPTATAPSSIPTAGAAANAAGVFLAGLGLAVAYML